MPRPLDTTAGALLRNRSRFATAIGLALLIAASTFYFQQVGPASSAEAANRSGGLGVPGKPQLKDAVCLSRCVAARKATPRSKVRLAGSYLNRVKRVVFAGSDGPVKVGFEKRGYGAVTAVVPKGASTGRIWVVTARGERSNKSPRELEVLPPSAIPEEVFPVRGAVNFGSSGARFGAPRGGYSHQGQDVMAACGTRMVAVRRSKVLYNTYQSAAGWYVVLKNFGSNTSFAYMHLRSKSPLRVGSVIGAGRGIGQVGQTGRAYGCHLHFEFWRGPWQTGGRPVDPLPYLRSLLRR